MAIYFDDTGNPREILDHEADLDPVDFMLLATAIANGDRAEADYRLDKIAECSDDLREHIQRGRFCRATRKAA